MYGPNYTTVQKCVASRRYAGVEPFPSVAPNFANVRAEGWIPEEGSGSISGDYGGLLMCQLAASVCLLHPQGTLIINE